MRFRLLAALVLVAAAVVASPAAGADRLKRYAVADVKASFAVPTTWVALNGRQVRTRAILEQLARDNPRLAPFLGSFAQAGSPVKFVALDPAVKGGFATNVNVVSLALPRAFSFEQYRELLLAEIRVLTQGSPIADAEVSIGGNRALRLRYRFRLNAAGRTFTAQTLQYAFLRGRTSVVFTYTTTPRHAAGYTRTFEASAASIRFAR